MKHLLAYMMIFLLSLQVLPVKQLGKLIKKMATEQVQDDDDDPGTARQQQLSEEETKHFLPHYPFQLRPAVADREALTALHRNCLIPPHFVPDVTTPPPNRC